jgi:hypothetical protein
MKEHAPLQITTRPSGPFGCEARDFLNRRSQVRFLSGSLENTREFQIGAEGLGRFAHRLPPFFGWPP